MVVATRNLRNMDVETANFWHVVSHALLSNAELAEVVIYTCKNLNLIYCPRCKFRKPAFTVSPLLDS